MTREEALAYIHEWLKDEYALNSKDTEALDMAIKALEQNSRWISVREKLPESYKKVLVYSGVDMFVAWWVESCKLWDSCDDCLDSNTKIIAWMPLPMPYKTESEGRYE